MNAIELSCELTKLLKEKPMFFADVLRTYSNLDYRTILQGWSELRSNVDLKRDDEGRYLIPT